MRAHLAPAFAVLLIAACSPEAAPPAPEPAPEAVLGGVDLNAPVRVLGTEPFWAVTIDGRELVYSGVDRPEQRAPNAGPQMQGAAAVWSARTDQAQDLSVTLVATECSDGMSDRAYPLTARVRIGDETLNGCAASVDFVMNTDEEGGPRP